MAHRPYPNVDRALNQIGRHYPEPPRVELECLRPVGEVFIRMREGARGALADAEPGRYVLSTRRPSVSPEVASRFPPEFIEQVNQLRRPGTVSGPA